MHSVPPAMSRQPQTVAWEAPPQRYTPACTATLPVADGQHGLPAETAGLPQARTT